MTNPLQHIQNNLAGHLPDGATVTDVVTNVSYIEYMVGLHVHRMTEAGVIELTGKTLAELVKGASQ